ncbi:hypothetical protein FGG08_004825 [Glutinoglossum americanum]|uniref:AB hydrolase-1 domain-containing protein n=1 Tax=Glutinoglossum americanum TaxID=1670608 RepID=A0A9P8I1L7_9PEZI|nr:hypothetical protein FGG08_004825 [Glutinoglossum americanum]
MAETLFRVLARDLERRVYTIDLRNHGHSDHHPRHDYTVMAQDVEGFIDQHKLGAVTLIGHSMYAHSPAGMGLPGRADRLRGAKTAMTVALRSPHLVKNLISVDNAPVDAALRNDFAKYIRGMQKVEERGVTRRSEANEILKEFEESLPIREFLLTNLVRPSGGSQAYKFRIPIKILASALDDMADFPLKDPDKARFALEDIEAGHWLISENPEAFRTG